MDLDGKDNLHLLRPTIVVKDTVLTSSSGLDRPLPLPVGHW